MKNYLLKRNRIKNENLRYDFLPPMLEVVERPSNPVGSFIILGIFLLLATTVVWASFFRLDVVVTAAGGVTPSDSLVLVQTQGSGVVTDIKVEDGDTVNEGDVIAQLEKSSVLDNIEELQYQEKLLEIQKELYEKIRDDAWEDIQADSYGDYAAVVKGILEEQKLYQNQVKEYELQVQMAEGKSREATNAALESYKIQRQVELLQKISNLEVQLVGIENDLRQARKNLEAADITAPASGTIFKLQVAHPGEMVSVSQTVGYILPEDAEMVFLCYIPNGDIAHIELGQTVEVKLDAYPYSRYGTIKGTVDYIDEIAVNVEGIGNAYTVYIVLEERDDIPYKMGLSGSCDIKVSDRTVLEYFLEPIQKGFGESLDEL